MKKTLYSLMLNDEVVREVDILAHRLGTNRSALIDRILAEYVDYVTPERRINDIFSAMEQLIAPERDLVPFFSPNSMSMSLKSSLEYRYRPTVKYEVELFRGGEDSIGELSVLFRTQSASLIQAMTSFFRAWKQTEDLLRGGPAPDYALYEGKFVRSIAVPARDCSAQELAEAISEYIKLFDRLLKRWLGGQLNAEGLREAYAAYLARETLRI